MSDDSEAEHEKTAYNQNQQNNGGKSLHRSSHQIPHQSLNCQKNTEQDCHNSHNRYHLQRQGTERRCVGKRKREGAVKAQKRGRYD